MPENDGPDRADGTATAEPTVADVLAMLGYFLAVGCFAGQFLTVRVAGIEGQAVNTALGVGMIAGFPLWVLFTIASGLTGRRR